MTDSSQGNIVGSGLLGKLLLPSYTDAGANSSFQSSSRGVPSDQGSQAATEVRDNRSSIKQQFRMNCSKHHHSCPDATNTASSTVFSPSQVGDVEAKYAGFFPSTKPQLSPRPSSPPSLPRQRTLIMSSAPSMAGTSVVPETGAFHFSLQDTERLETLERALEKENQRRVYYWENERSASAEKNNLMLNAANLYRVEKDRERQRASPTNSSSHCSPRPNRNTSLLNDDDVGSDVMSTASEMGTVIELGNNAARMAEIDAMAALIEASPNIDALTPRSETSPPAPSRMSQRRTAEDTVASLALPELDSTPNEAIILARQTTANSLTSTLSTEQDKKEQFSAANPTPAELLSLALRRIGTGLNKTKASLSAPPTPKTPILPPPPRVEDLLKVSLTPRGYRHNFYEDFAENLSQDLPPSLALRSPGSSARLSLRRLAHQQQNSETKAILAPRFSPTDTSKILRSSPSFDSALSNDQTLKVKSLSSSMANMSRRESTDPLKLNPLSPFRLAQKCFSYDSTLDEALDTGSATGSATSSHILNLESSYPFHRQTEYNRKHKIKESVSWDVGGASGAFRVQPHRSHRIGALRPTTSQIEHNAQRVRVHSDFSPGRLENVEGAFRENQDKLHARHSHHQGTVLQLQTPDRFVVDVEREDALDILACLVERGVAAWNEESNKNSANESTESSTQMREALIANMVEELRMSRNDGEECQDDNVSDKIMALEELLKTHSYATEMKRAALSASTWLRSIGRGPQILNDNHVQDSTMNVFIQPLEVGQASGEDAGSDKQSDTNSSFLAAAADSKMEILTLKARLHSCESELREKMIVNQKLDEELCKCRAEIGRLRTASRNEMTITHTHSIIDEEAEDSVTVSLGPSVPIEPQIKDTSAVSKEESESEESNLFDESFQGNNSLFQDVSMQEDGKYSQEIKNLDSSVLKTALEQANDTIRLLHEKLQKNVSDDKRNEPPTIAIPETSESTASEKKGAEIQSSTVLSDEHRTINVRMLDGENFITDWDELTSPLPPPPDHGLRSPIVNAVLKQWTDDHHLHHSLLAWMERVMMGDNLEDTVPPLTISSLDHQVRDGFIMHVLPLLLRRADIHVSVQMRVHRRTTYDLAVSVNQKRVLYDGQAVESRSPSLLDQHGQDDWGDKRASTDSGAHSAITVPVENVVSRNSQQEDMEYSHFGIPNVSSEDLEDNPQSTFMGALGGALGGLLSRGKYTAIQSPSRFTGNASPHGFPPHSSRASLDTVSSTASGNRMAELDYQPYHRVVSAPPGRIGVTFVEYRGHAMVADMAPDSPLSSWVFPSDILIAVDEVPVSGMRVRDIIKILTNRKDRQRALRVISSHAMNEFTLNQSTMGDEAP